MYAFDSARVRIGVWIKAGPQPLRYSQLSQAGKTAEPVQIQ